MTWVTPLRAQALVRMWHRATEPVDSPYTDQSIRRGTRSELEALPSDFEFYWADEFLKVGGHVPQDLYTTLIVTDRFEQQRLRKEIQIFAASEREYVQSMLEFQ